MIEHSLHQEYRIYEYDIKYSDYMGDEITESFESLIEAKKFIQEIKEDSDKTLLRTWRYLDGKYLGYIK